ncbi:MAG: phosphopantothenoylcysteine decarboxylase [Planctomycetota bacterium]
MTHTHDHPNGSLRGPLASGGAPKPRLLITAGPTQEPVDAVRFLGNRSSGRLGVDLAAAAARRGWSARLLLGRGASVSPDVLDQDWVSIERFGSTSDLAQLLDRHFPSTDVLVMAAAVADYRPVIEDGDLETKLRRVADRLVIECEPTPDLLAGLGARKRDDQLLVGFALEPEAQLEASGRRKLERKNADLIVANPLETMDSPDIRATLIAREGLGLAACHRLEKTSKDAFADRLLDVAAEARRALLVSTADDIAATDTQVKS